jgi:DNA-binding beta-propeller fold protein YncE
VSDTYNERVQKFTPSGDFLRAWGTLGNGEGEFWGPIGIAITRERLVLVCDTGNGRIEEFSGDGQFLVTWGRPGSAPGEFAADGVAAGRDGFIYVADSGNHRVQKFQQQIVGVQGSSWSRVKASFR